MLRKVLTTAAFGALSCSVYEASLLRGRSAAGGAGDGGGPAATGGVSGSANARAGGRSGAGSGGDTLSGGGGGVPEAGEGGAPNDDAGTGGVLDGGDGGEATSGEGGSAAGSGGEGAGGASGRGGEAGAAGKGGNSGAGGVGGGSAGNGGVGGDIAGSGGTSGGGTAGSAGSGETCSGATGCARLSVPLTSAMGRTFFVIDLPALTDFRTARLTYRIFLVSGSGGRVLAFVQHGGTPPGDYNLIQGGVRTLSSLSGWTSVTWDVAGTVPGFTFDKSVIARIGIEVSGAGSTAWTNPTVLYLDSISVEMGPSIGPFTFDTATSIDPEVTQPNVLGIANNPGDFVPGSTLGWLGP